jgi:hypothetical protein
MRQRKRAGDGLNNRGKNLATEIEKSLGPNERYHMAKTKTISG